MSTSGSFTPPAVVECPYAARMTRAQAIALRTAGGLRENCVVVVTDGPTIGTAGNTSVTEIELNPVGPSDLGMSARVHTTFDDSAWAGLYDIDLGAAGSIVELADAWGNVVRDPDADAPTVHAGFPWHKSGSAFRDNLIDDATLTGWDVPTAVSGNTVRRATVDLSGGWSFQNNQVHNGGVFLQSTAPAVRSFTGNVLRDSAMVRVAAGAGGTGACSISDNEFLDGYVIDVAATSVGPISIDGSRFENHGAAPIDCQINMTGTGQVLFNNARSTAHPTQQQYTLLGAGAGNVSILADVLGGRLIRDAATTANASLSAGCRVLGVVTQGASATGGALLLANSTLDAPGTLVNHLGPGTLTVQSSHLIGGGVTVAAGATRGLGLVSTVVQAGTVLQNRTGGTGVDQLVGSYVEGQGNVVTFNGSVDPGGSQTLLNSSRVVGLASVTLTDPAAGVVLQQTEVSDGAQVTGTGTGLVQACRFSCLANVNLGAFAHDTTIVEGGFTRTLTGPNSNRRLTKSFDDLVAV